jgi:hypothetical protein
MPGQYFRPVGGGGAGYDVKDINQRRKTNFTSCSSAGICAFPYYKNQPRAFTGKH